MLGNRLARNRRAARKKHDRQRSLAREPHDDSQTGFVAQRREQMRGIGALKAARAIAVRDMLCVSASGCSARYFSISFICAAQPCSLLVKALGRRSSGMRSKPDSVTVSIVRPATSSSSKTTVVKGLL